MSTVEGSSVQEMYSAVLMSLSRALWSLLGAVGEPCLHAACDDAPHSALVGIYS